MLMAIRWHEILSDHVIRFCALRTPRSAREVSLRIEIWACRRADELRSATCCAAAASSLALRPKFRLYPRCEARSRSTHASYSGARTRVPFEHGSAEFSIVLPTRPYEGVTAPMSMCLRADPRSGFFVLVKNVAV